MDQPEFLKEILEKKIIYPRYCRENIEYMDLELGGYHFSEILVLQKCFCDIPLHNITRKANVRMMAMAQSQKVSMHTQTSMGNMGLLFRKAGLNSIICSHSSI